jgi:hypothetical protein
MKRVPIISCLLALVASGPAAAFTVGTGFSEDCHERITRAAWSRILARSPLGPVPSPAPGGQGVELLSARLLPHNALASFAVPPEQRDVLLQLLVGVQAPDTHGHSMLDLENTRGIHAAPGDQYPHALRGHADDGVEGDRAAIAGTRARLKASIERFRAALEKPPGEQFARSRYFLDDYGMVDFEAWTPATHLGEALHTLQDSFSHTLRTDDFRRIRHVFNYEDAIYDHFDESRDGIRHSASMDTCEDDTRPIVQAATEASTELLLAAMAGANDVDPLLDRWMGYEEGCSFSNDYCHSSWLGVARKTPTGPYLGCAMTPDATLWGLPGLLLWVSFRRRPRRGV